MEKWAAGWRVYIIVAVVVLLILAAVFYFGYSSKSTSNVNILNDEGGVSTASASDQQSASTLASKLYSNLVAPVIGILWSTFADTQVFEDLSATSNVVFALTFSDYQNSYNRSLLSDLQSSLQYFNTSSIDSSIQRAKTLGVS